MEVTVENPTPALVEEDQVVEYDDDYAQEDYDDGDDSDVVSADLSDGEDDEAKPAHLDLGPTAPPKPPRHRVPGDFKCHKCDATFIKVSRLNQHMQTHSDERPFVCTWEGCGKGFKRATHLNRHMMVHQQLFPFKCTWEGCERAYVQKCQLDKHIITHTTPKPYACTWEGCSESFSKHNKLRRHICTHTGALPYPCTEPNCTVAFNHPSHLKRHIASVHQRTSACHPSHPSMLSAHNSSLWPVITAQVKIVSSFHATLATSIVHMHRPPPWTKSFESNADLDLLLSFKLHSPDSTDKKKNICDREGCTEAFETHNELRKHIAAAHPKPRHVCDVCSRSFTNVTHFNDHKKTHDLVRTLFPCSQCDKEFSTKANLGAHVRAVHERLRPFACTIDGCTDTFSYKRCLERHIRARHETNELDEEAPAAKRSKPAKSVAEQLLVGVEQS